MIFRSNNIRAGCYFVQALQFAVFDRVSRPDTSKRRTSNVKN